MSFIHVENVTFRYGTDDPLSLKEALSGVSLAVEKGEFVALLGHNGCGKSTLAKHFNAMLLPTSGKVFVDGMDTTEEALKYEIRRRVGLVLQNPDNQLVASIVEEDVAFGPENLGVPPKEIRQRVDDALKAVEMYDYRLAAPYKLSGGQKRRVAIAGIIAMQPECIVLDEPTAMLDPRGRTEVLDTIHKLNQELGITIVLITHYMDEAVTADRVVVMDSGRILTEGTPKEVFSKVELFKAASFGCAAGDGALLPVAGLRLSGAFGNIGCGRMCRDFREAFGGRKMPILETQDLTYVYGAGTPFEKTAVDHISLQIEEGELVGVIGHTGSGKSTFVQQLNGLLKPTSGKVLLKGKDIWAEPKKIRIIRFQVGMVFQYPEHQLFEETVEKDIAFGPKNMGLSEEEIKRRVKMAAAFAGLKDNLLGASPFEISGGEKRRAAIAGVIAMDPEVLILDEPTAGLDPMGRDVLLSQIVDYHRQRNNTVLLVSHSMEDIARIADRVLVIDDGKVAMFEKTDRVFAQSARLSQMGLRVPQITKIMTMLREKGYPVSSGVLTVEQGVQEILRILGREEESRGQ